MGGGVGATGVVGSCLGTVGTNLVSGRAYLQATSMPSQGECFGSVLTGLARLILGGSCGCHTGASGLRDEATVGVRVGPFD